MKQVVFLNSGDYTSNLAIYNNEFNTTDYNWMNRFQRKWFGFEFATNLLDTDDYYTLYAKYGTEGSWARMEDQHNIGISSLVLSFS